tara:strand:+ start:3799 stop:4812 length:1014 start_codon:yes stop_codon:yes gene_type:complete
MVQPAMSNTGNQSGVGMASANARPGAPDTGSQHDAPQLAATQMAYQKHYTRPTRKMQLTGQEIADERKQMDAQGVPSWMGNYQDDEVPYDAPTEYKEYMQRKLAATEAAGQFFAQAPNNKTNVNYTVDDSEVAYLKSMKDQAELARFDAYVSQFIDPKQPGNMKWIMEVYPDFVKRRLQQVHTDHEFALRNRMIDTWGINSLDDMHFKYQVDQGMIEGPSLSVAPSAVDALFTPGYMSLWSGGVPDGSGSLARPYSSSMFGTRPPATGDGAKAWQFGAEKFPLSTGNSNKALAKGMYFPDTKPVTGAPVISGARTLAQERTFSRAGAADAARASARP